MKRREEEEEEVYGAIRRDVDGCEEVESGGGVRSDLVSQLFKGLHQTHASRFPPKPYISSRSIYTPHLQCSLFAPGAALPKPLQRFSSSDSPPRRRRRLPPPPPPPPLPRPHS